MIAINAMRQLHPISIRPTARRRRRAVGQWAVRIVALFAVWVATTFAAVQGVRAQSGDLAGGELNPFPQSDVYRLHFVGDWWMDGLKPRLEASLKAQPSVRIEDGTLEVRSLRRTNWAENVETIKARSAKSALDITIVMFGASEIGSVFTPERHRFGTESWTRIYAQRVDSLMKALKADKGAVYWIGLPIVQRRDHSEGFQLINTLIRERAYTNGVNFIDVYARFQDENGGFSRYGPDLDGTIKLLRTKDGVYFTSNGYEKIAQFVMQMIGRDLKSAKAQRVVTLAGDEAELQSIRRANQPVARKTPAQAAGTAAGDAAPAPYDRLRGSSLPADDTTVELDLHDAAMPGRLRIELPRPALSAAVISLVARSQPAGQPARHGDSAVEVAPGGIPLMSTITPADQSALALRRRRLSPTQSTFFKVWGKGERLTPKPGRADDFSWPHAEPEPVVHATARAEDTSGLERFPARDPNLPPLPLRNPMR